MLLLVLFFRVSAHLNVEAACFSSETVALCFPAKPFSLNWICGPTWKLSSGAEFLVGVSDCGGLVVSVFCMRPIPMNIPCVAAGMPLTCDALLTG